MKDTFQEVCSFNSTGLDISRSLDLGLFDQKLLVASAYSWTDRENNGFCFVLFCLTYSSFCLCGIYIVVHWREGFPKTQVTSAHYYIWNNIVSIDILNLTGPERFPVNVNQHSLENLLQCASAQLSVLSGLCSGGITMEVITETHGFSQDDTDMCNLLIICSNMIHIYHLPLITKWLWVSMDIFLTGPCVTRAR